MEALKLNILVVMVVVLVGFAGVALGDYVISNPDQLIGSGNSQGLWMNYGDNLMERVNGEDCVVDKGEGEYYLLFAKEVSGSLMFGAYLETDNYNSDIYEGYEGWCNGRADRNVFLEGESPDYVLGIYDDDGGAFAMTGSQGLFLDENLVVWESGGKYVEGSGSIEYGGVIDGLLDREFGPNEGGKEWFDSIFLVPPEPIVFHPGDANLDGIVDLEDFVILKNNFGVKGAGWEQANFNDDDVVDLADFVILKNNFGTTAGVPEPATLSMLAVSGLLLLKKK